jgi:hypothetical protein
MNKRPNCDDAHAGYEPTKKLRRDPDRADVTWRVWVCQCGRREMLVMPNAKKPDWM